MAPPPAGPARVHVHLPLRHPDAPATAPAALPDGLYEDVVSEALDRELPLLADGTSVDRGERPIAITYRLQDAEIPADLLQTARSAAA